jgi:4-carboxymuconolactone decarboxylase
MGEESELYEAGLTIRKEVVGADYVQRSLDSATAFTAPLQSLVTEFAWGAVWGREALDRRTRSLINVAMLTAMNRQTELALHVRGALRNGCTVTEIREVLLQSAVYCGFPAALEGFRTAGQAIVEAGKSLDEED